MSYLPLSDAEMSARSHESRAGAIIWTGTAFTGLACAAVFARIASRRLGRTALGPEDWFAIASVIPMVGMSTLWGLAAGQYGFGRHSWVIEDHKMIRLLLTAANHCYLLTTMLFKFSFLALYIRIFPSRGMHLIAYTIGSVIIAATMVWSVVVASQCRPFAKIWDDSIPGYCVNEPASYGTNGVFNMVTDLAIFLLPIPMIWNLQMAKKRKLMLSGRFLVGLIVCAVSIVRLPYLFQNTTADLSWGGTPRVLLSLMECGVAILCSCMSTYVPLYQKLRGREVTTRDLTYGIQSADYANGIYDFSLASLSNRLGSRATQDVDSVLAE